MLYIVATPIGNLTDITYRAVEVLKSADLIATEDTRHARKLLDHYQIDTRLLPLHEHNEQQASQKILHALKQGKSVALISDAGTPLISDPGTVLVPTIQQAGFKVVPIPGPCAAITALSAAGLSTEQFKFIGFLPAKGEVRLKALQAYQAENATMVFYESPKRIIDFLQLAIEVFGSEHQAAIARELTKQFETIKQATLAALLEFVQSDPMQQKGEFVVMLAGSEHQPDQVENERILKILLTELPVKKAAKLAAQITGESKNIFYERALSLK